MKKYYSYLLINSLTSQPFYVGKGVRSRMYQHKRDALNPNYCYRSVHRKIQSIIKNGGDILYKKVKHLTESDAFKNEIKLIKQYGRKDLKTGLLCNLTDGGEGTTNQDPESIKQRAKKHRGMKRSEESKKYMSQVQKELAEKRRKEYGKACSPETSRKMSNSRKGKKWSEKAREVKRKNPRSKIIFVYKKSDESFVGEWENMASCARELNCDHSAIWKICKGDWMSRTPDGKLRPYKSHKGYIFKFKD